MQSELTKILEAKGYNRINNTEDFNKLKINRAILFEARKEVFLRKREQKSIETNETDLMLYYISQLKDEIKTIELWLSDREPNGDKKPVPNISIQIELAKYQRHINSEIAITSQKLQNIENPNQEITTETYSSTTDQNIPPPAQKLRLKLIALKYVYLEQQITRQNATQIAVQYGHSSGETLFQDYTYYNSRSNRRAKPDTLKKLKNKIELFESVIPLLPENKQDRLSDEIRHLKTLFKNDLF